MQRALQLANKGRYSTAPNPRVGCVIVHEGQIIGEGFHQKYGEAHAEVNAIASVQDENKLKNSTLYVTLEPCAHHGKTPPCSDLIIGKGIPRVVIASKDPFNEVNGKGIEKLKQADVEVEQGVLEKEAYFLNRRFFTFHQKERPFIILKWAETIDGFIGRNQGDPKATDSWITSPMSKQVVHLWRAEESAILVGQSTAKIDNPALNCREVTGENPIRLVLDQELRLEQSLQVFDQSIPTLVINEVKSELKENLEFLKMKFDHHMLRQLMKELHRRNIQSIIVEGGAFTINRFLELNLWDEIRRFVGQKKFENGIKAPLLKLEPHHQEYISTDTLYYYYQ